MSSTGRRVVVLDGQHLDIAALTAIARGEADVAVEPAALDRLLDSEKRLVTGHRKEGAFDKPMYGINVPFGAAAYSTVQGERMQTLENQLAGLLYGDLGRAGLLADDAMDGADGSSSASRLDLSMPKEWVRGAIALRAHGFLRGHSGVRSKVLRGLLALLEHDIVPLVPIRGSISASGDLSPLAYIAWAATGRIDLRVRAKDGSIKTARQALEECRIPPINFTPRELLATGNGTAVSASVAALAMQQMRRLFYASQVVTALVSEAMLASSSHLDPFIHDVARPHPGQVQVARNLRALSKDSTLLRAHDEAPVAKIRALSGGGGGASVLCAEVMGEQGQYLLQDRYHIRTSPQVLGPAWEDLEAAHQSLLVELNSTTDNPLVRESDGAVLHGGNFQGFAVTFACEKMRDVAAMTGRLLHDQLFEVINSTTNNALPACLALHDSETDGGLRGVDIACASYVSELCFLAQRANHFSRNAESGNQSINSMALLGARLALDSAEVLTSLVASALFVAAHALDLRLITTSFFAMVSDKLEAVLMPLTDDISAIAQDSIVWAALSTWMRTWHLTTTCRAAAAGRAFAAAAATATSTQSKEGAASANCTHGFSQMQHRVASLLEEAWSDHRAEAIASAKEGKETVARTGLQLGRGSDQVRRFIRRELGVSMYCGVQEAFIPTDQEPRTVGDAVTELANALREAKFDALWIHLQASST
ncbi:L-Aspartase-like protein [Ceraceosorus guamensis]|uniref:L-Aspartase-like protein n=1 Tax=Ceraceosorus guamensis TaxID=1522189 RepID=A0A316VT23_9BASI|nr:L-Aspartase-like protein [Ceraceosorus guamensis]PWN39361.1 L-Aspartase-like protein [Ceraceosorus guamensis]